MLALHEFEEFLKDQGQVERNLGYRTSYFELGYLVDDDEPINDELFDVGRLGDEVLNQEWHELVDIEILMSWYQLVQQILQTVVQMEYHQPNFRVLIRDYWEQGMESPCE